MSATARTSRRSFEEELDQLLSESVEAAKKREQNAFDEIAAPYEKRLVLFGCGRLGKRTLVGLRRVGIEPLAFTDNNRALWGKKLEGVPILPPADAAREYGRNATFVVTIWNATSDGGMADRVREITELECKRVVPVGYLFWRYPDAFLPHYAIDLPHKLLERSAEVRSALDLWADDASKREYIAQIVFRLTLRTDEMGHRLENHYFAPDLYRLRPDETLIDCGAFDGDTIRSFLRLTGGQFSKIFAYEPDVLNWEELEKTLQGLPTKIRSRIHCFPKAIGAFNGPVAFEPTGTDNSMVGVGSSQVDCVRLDDELADVSPTIIKFDIEGAEPEGLEGAREVVRGALPVLAVSTYHQQAHLWEIATAISRTSEKYSLFLRPHGSESWDLVCYAIPPHRLCQRDGSGA